MEMLWNLHIGHELVRLTKYIIVNCWVTSKVERMCVVCRHHNKSISVVSDVLGSFHGVCKC